MKLRRLLLILLFGVGISTSLLASSIDDLKNTVSTQFQGKMLILLHPLGKESLRFNTDGTLIKGGSPGPWTVYGAIRVTKVQLSPDKLRVQGQRLFFSFKSSHPAPYVFALRKNRNIPPCRPSVEVEIKLDQPLNSFDQVQTTLSKVFALNKQDFLNSVPEFWRSYVADNLDFDPAQAGALQYIGGNSTHAGKSPDANAKTSSQAGNQPDQAIFHVGNDVKAPKAISTPEPEFSEAARYEKYQGVVVVSIVVDKNGNVANVNIVRPLGLGLDEQAANKIKSWRFNPGTRNGQPVDIEMNIEVSFNLY
ncbi:MAG TPA: energy transducer TonB [Candidatus Angelobacter sp.]|nr:energy transducer TonB [Candidatus Angelobacter sp.]